MQIIYATFISYDFLRKKKYGTVPSDSSTSPEGLLKNDPSLPTSA